MPKLRRIPPVLILAIAAHLAITLPLAAKLCLYVDESYSRHTSGSTLGYALHQAIHFESQPPLYFLILNLWLRIHSSMFFGRLLSIACTTAMLCAVWPLSRRVLPALNPGWIVGPLALSPFFVWAAIETRPYALAMLLGTLTLLFFYITYLEDSPGPLAPRIYVLLSTACLFTYYYLGFLLVANCAALLATKRWAAAREYLKAMVLVGLIFAPFLAIAYVQIGLYPAAKAVPTGGLAAIGFLARRMVAYALPLGGLSPWPARLVRTGFVVGFGAVMIGFRRSVDRKIGSLLVILLVVACFFWVLVREMYEVLLTVRHTFVLFLPSVLLAFAPISLLPARYRRRACLGWTILVLSCSISGLYFHYRVMAKAGDHIRVARYIQENEGPDQPILVFFFDAALPLAYHYSGINTIVPIPQPEDFRTFDMYAFVLESEKQVLDSLARIPGEHERVWLVTNYNLSKCEYLGVSLNCSLMEEFVDKYYTVEMSRRFYVDTLIRLLHRKNAVGAPSDPL